MSLLSWRSRMSFCIVVIYCILISLYTINAQYTSGLSLSGSSTCPLDHNSISQYIADCTSPTVQIAPILSLPARNPLILRNTLLSFDIRNPKLHVNAYVNYEIPSNIVTNADLLAATQTLPPLPTGFTTSGIPVRLLHLQTGSTTRIIELPNELIDLLETHPLLQIWVIFALVGIDGNIVGSYQQNPYLLSNNIDGTILTAIDYANPSSSCPNGSHLLSSGSGMYVCECSNGNFGRTCGDSITPQHHTRLDGDSSDITLSLDSSTSFDLSTVSFSLVPTDYSTLLHYSNGIPVAMIDNGNNEYTTTITFASLLWAPSYTLMLFQHNRWYTLPITIQMKPMFGMYNLQYNPIDYNRNTPLSFDLAYNGAGLSSTSTLPLEPSLIPSDIPMYGFGYELGKISLVGTTLGFVSMNNIVHCLATYTGNDYALSTTYPSDLPIKLIPTDQITPNINDYTTERQQMVNNIPKTISSPTYTQINSIYQSFDVWIVTPDPIERDRLISMDKFSIRCPAHIRIESTNTNSKPSTTIAAVFRWLPSTSSSTVDIPAPFLSNVYEPVFINGNSIIPSYINPIMKFANSQLDSERGVLLSVEFIPPSIPFEWPYGITLMDEWMVIDGLAMGENPNMLRQSGFFFDQEMTPSTRHIISMLRDEGYNDFGIPCIDIDNNDKIVGHFIPTLNDLARPIALLGTSPVLNVRSGMLLTSKQCRYTLNVSPTWLSKSMFNHVYDPNDLTLVTPQRIASASSSIVGVNYHKFDTFIPFNVQYPSDLNDGINIQDGNDIINTHLKTPSSASNINERYIIELEVMNDLSYQRNTDFKATQLSLHMGYDFHIWTNNGVSDLEDLMVCYWGRDTAFGNNNFVTDLWTYFDTLDINAPGNDKLAFTCANGNNSTLGTGVVPVKMDWVTNFHENDPLHQDYKGSTNSRRCLRLRAAEPSATYKTFSCRMGFPLPLDATIGLPTISIHPYSSTSTNYPILPLTTFQTTSTSPPVSIHLLNHDDRWVALPTGDFGTTRSHQFVTIEPWTEKFWSQDLSSSTTNTLYQQNGWVLGNSNTHLVASPKYARCDSLGMGQDSYEHCLTIDIKLYIKRPTTMPTLQITTIFAQYDNAFWTDTATADDILNLPAMNVKISDSNTFDTPGALPVSNLQHVTIVPRSHTPLFVNHYSWVSTQNPLPHTVNSYEFTSHEKTFFPLFDMKDPHKMTFTPREEPYYVRISIPGRSRTNGFLNSSNFRRLAITTAPLATLLTSRRTLPNYRHDVSGGLSGHPGNYPTTGPELTLTRILVSGPIQTRHAFTADWNSQHSELSNVGIGSDYHSVPPQTIDFRTVPADLIDSIWQWLRERCYSKSTLRCDFTMTDSTHRIPINKDATAFATYNSLSTLRVDRPQSDGFSTFGKPRIDIAKTQETNPSAPGFDPFSVFPMRGTLPFFEIDFKSDKGTHGELRTEFQQYLQRFFASVVERHTVSIKLESFCNYNPIHSSYKMCGNSCSDMNCKLVYNQLTIDDFIHPQPPSLLSGNEYKPNDIIGYATGTRGWNTDTVFKRPLTLTQAQITKETIFVGYFDLSISKFNPNDMTAYNTNYGYDQTPLNRHTRHTLSTELPEGRTFPYIHKIQLPNSLYAPSFIFKQDFNNNAFPFGQSAIITTDGTDPHVMKRVGDLYTTTTTTLAYDSNTASVCNDGSKNTFGDATSGNENIHTSFITDTCFVNTPICENDGTSMDSNYYYPWLNGCMCPIGFWGPHCENQLMSTSNTSPIPYERFMGIPYPSSRFLTDKLDTLLSSWRVKYDLLSNMPFTRTYEFHQWSPSRQQDWVVSIVPPYKNDLAYLMPMGASQSGLIIRIGRKQQQGTNNLQIPNLAFDSLSQLETNLENSSPSCSGEKCFRSIRHAVHSVANTDAPMIAWPFVQTPQRLVTPHIYNDQLWIASSPVTLVLQTPSSYTSLPPQTLVFVPQRSITQLASLGDAVTVPVPISLISFDLSEFVFKSISSTWAIESFPFTEWSGSDHSLIINPSELCSGQRPTTSSYEYITYNRITGIAHCTLPYQAQPSAILLPTVSNSITIKRALDITFELSSLDNPVLELEQHNGEYVFPRGVLFRIQYEIQTMLANLNAYPNGPNESLATPPLTLISVKFYDQVNYSIVSTYVKFTYLFNSAVIPTLGTDAAILAAFRQHTVDGSLINPTWGLQSLLFQTATTTILPSLTSYDNTNIFPSLSFSDPNYGGDADFVSIHKYVPATLHVGTSDITITNIITSRPDPNTNIVNLITNDVLNIDPYTVDLTKNISFSVDCPVPFDASTDPSLDIIFDIGITISSPSLYYLYPNGVVLSEQPSIQSTSPLSPSAVCFSQCPLTLRCLSNISSTPCVQDTCDPAFTLPCDTTDNGLQVLFGQWTSSSLANYIPQDHYFAASSSPWYFTITNIGSIPQANYRLFAIVGSDAIELIDALLTTSLPNSIIYKVEQIGTTTLSQSDVQIILHYSSDPTDLGLGLSSGQVYRIKPRGLSTSLFNVILTGDCSSTSCAANPLLTSYCTPGETTVCHCTQRAQGEFCGECQYGFGDSCQLRLIQDDPSGKLPVSDTRGIDIYSFWFPGQNTIIPIENLSQQQVIFAIKVTHADGSPILNVNGPIPNHSLSATLQPFETIYAYILNTLHTTLVNENVIDVDMVQITFEQINEGDEPLGLSHHMYLRFIPTLDYFYTTYPDIAPCNPTGVASYPNWIDGECVCLNNIVGNKCQMSISITDYDTPLTQDQLTTIYRSQRLTITPSRLPNVLLEGTLEPSVANVILLLDENDNGMPDLPGYSIPPTHGFYQIPTLGQTTTFPTTDPFRRTATMIITIEYNYIPYTFERTVIVGDGCLDIIANPCDVTFTKHCLPRQLEIEQNQRTYPLCLCDYDHWGPTCSYHKQLQILETGEPNFSLSWSSTSDPFLHFLVPKQYQLFVPGGTTSSHQVVIKLTSVAKTGEVITSSQFTPTGEKWSFSLPAYSGSEVNIFEYTFELSFDGFEYADNELTFPFNQAPRYTFYSRKATPCESITSDPSHEKACSGSLGTNYFACSVHEWDSLVTEPFSGPLSDGLNCVCTTHFVGPRCEFEIHRTTSTAFYHGQKFQIVPPTVNSESTWSLTTVEVMLIDTDNAIVDTLTVSNDGTITIPSVSVGSYTIKFKQQIRGRYGNDFLYFNANEQDQFTIKNTCEYLTSEYPDLSCSITGTASCNPIYAVTPTPGQAICMCKDGYFGRQCEFFASVPPSPLYNSGDNHQIIISPSFPHPFDTGSGVSEWNVRFDNGIAQYDVMHVQKGISSSFTQIFYDLLPTRPPPGVYTVKYNWVLGSFTTSGGYTYAQYSSDWQVMTEDVILDDNCGYIQRVADSTSVCQEMNRDLSYTEGTFHNGCSASHYNDSPEQWCKCKPSYNGLSYVGFDCNSEFQFVQQEEIKFINNNPISFTLSNIPDVNSFTFTLHPVDNNQPIDLVWDTVSNTLTLPPNTSNEGEYDLLITSIDEQRSDFDTTHILPNNAHILVGDCSYIQSQKSNWCHVDHRDQSEPLCNAIAFDSKDGITPVCSCRNDGIQGKAIGGPGCEYIVEIPSDNSPNVPLFMYRNVPITITVTQDSLYTLDVTYSLVKEGDITNTIVLLQDDDTLTIPAETTALIPGPYTLQITTNDPSGQYPSRTFTYQPVGLHIEVREGKCSHCVQANTSTCYPERQYINTDNLPHCVCKDGYIGINCEVLVQLDSSDKRWHPSQIDAKVLIDHTSPHFNPENDNYIKLFSFSLEGISETIEYEYDQIIDRYKLRLVNRIQQYNTSHNLMITYKMDKGDGNSDISTTSIVQTIEMLSDCSWLGPSTCNVDGRDSCNALNFQTQDGPYCICKNNRLGDDCSIGFTLSSYEWNRYQKDIKLTFTPNHANAIAKFSTTMSIIDTIGANLQITTPESVNVVLTIDTTTSSDYWLISIPDDTVPLDSANDNIGFNLEYTWRSAIHTAVSSDSTTTIDIIDDCTWLKDVALFCNPTNTQTCSIEQYNLPRDTRTEHVCGCQLGYFDEFCSSTLSTTSNVIKISQYTSQFSIDITFASNNIMDKISNIAFVLYQQGQQGQPDVEIALDYAPLAENILQQTVVLHRPSGMSHFTTLGQYTLKMSYSIDGQTNVAYTSMLNKNVVIINDCEHLIDNLGICHTDNTQSCSTASYYTTPSLRTIPMCKCKDGFVGEDCSVSVSPSYPNWFSTINNIDINFVDTDQLFVSKLSSFVTFYIVNSDDDTETQLNYVQPSFPSDLQSPIKVTPATALAQGTYTIKMVYTIDSIEQTIVLDQSISVMSDCDWLIDINNPCTDVGVSGNTQSCNAFNYWNDIQQEPHCECNAGYIGTNCEIKVSFDMTLFGDKMYHNEDHQFIYTITTPIQGEGQEEQEEQEHPYNAGIKNIAIMIESTTSTTTPPTQYVLIQESDISIDTVVNTFILSSSIPSDSYNIHITTTLSNGYTTTSILPDPADTSSTPPSNLIVQVVTECERIQHYKPTFCPVENRDITQLSFGCDWYAFASESNNREACACKTGDVGTVITGAGCETIFTIPSDFASTTHPLFFYYDTPLLINIVNLPDNLNDDSPGYKFELVNSDNTNIIHPLNFNSATSKLSMTTIPTPEGSYIIRMTTYHDNYPERVVDYQPKSTHIEVRHGVCTGCISQNTISCHPENEFNQPLNAPFCLCKDGFIGIDCGAIVSIGEVAPGTSNVNTWHGRQQGVSVQFDVQTDSKTLRGTNSWNLDETIPLDFKLGSYQLTLVTPDAASDWFSKEISLPTTSVGIATGLSYDITLTYALNNGITQTVKLNQNNNGIIIQDDCTWLSHIQEPCNNAHTNTCNALQYQYTLLNTDNDFVCNCKPTYFGTDCSMQFNLELVYWHEQQLDVKVTFTPSSEHFTTFINNYKDVQFQLHQTTQTNTIYDLETVTETDPNDENIITSYIVNVKDSDTLPKESFDVYILFTYRNMVTTTLVKSTDIVTVGEDCTWAHDNDLCDTSNVTSCDPLYSHETIERTSQVCFCRNTYFDSGCRSHAELSTLQWHRVMQDALLTFAVPASSFSVNIDTDLRFIAKSTTDINDIIILEYSNIEHRSDNVYYTTLSVPVNTQLTIGSYYHIIIEWKDYGFMHTSILTPSDSPVEVQSDCDYMQANGHCSNTNVDSCNVESFISSTTTTLPSCICSQGYIGSDCSVGVSIDSTDWHRRQQGIVLTIIDNNNLFNDNNNNNQSELTSPVRLFLQDKNDDQITHDVLIVNALLTTTTEISLNDLIANNGIGGPEIGSYELHLIYTYNNVEQSVKLIDVEIHSDCDWLSHPSQSSSCQSPGTSSCNALEYHHSGEPSVRTSPVCNCNENYFDDFCSSRIFIDNTNNHVWNGIIQNAPIVLDFVNIDNIPSLEGLEFTLTKKDDSTITYALSYSINRQNPKIYLLSFDEEDVTTTPLPLGNDYQLTLTWITAGYTHSVVYNADISIIDNCEWLKTIVNVCSVDNTDRCNINAYYNNQSYDNNVDLIMCVCKGSYYGDDCNEQVVWKDTNAVFSGIGNIIVEYTESVLSPSISFQMTGIELSNNGVEIVFDNEFNGNAPASTLSIQRPSLQEPEEQHPLGLYSLTFTYPYRDGTITNNVLAPITTGTTTTTTESNIIMLNDKDYMVHIGKECSPTNTASIDATQLYYDDNNYCICKDGYFGRQCEFTLTVNTSLELNEFKPIDKDTIVETGAIIQINTEDGYSYLTNNTRYYIMNLYSSTTHDTITSPVFIKTLEMSSSSSSNDNIIDFTTTNTNQELIYPYPTTTYNTVEDGKFYFINFFTFTSPTREIPQGIDFSSPDIIDLRYNSPIFNTIQPKLAIRSSILNSNTRTVEIEWLPPKRLENRFPSTLYHSFYLFELDSNRDAIKSIDDAIVPLTVSINNNNNNIIITNDQIYHLPETLTTQFTINIPKIQSLPNGFEILIIPTSLPDGHDVNDPTIQPVVVRFTQSLLDVCQSKTCSGNNGKCNVYTGECVCNNGFYGSSCELTTPPMNTNTKCYLQCPPLMTPSSTCSQCICTTLHCNQYTRVGMIYFNTPISTTTQDIINTQSSHSFIKNNIIPKFNRLIGINTLPLLPTLYTGQPQYSYNNDVQVGIETIKILPLVVNSTDLRAVAFFMTIQPFIGTSPTLSQINQRFDIINNRLNNIITARTTTTTLPFILDLHFIVNTSTRPLPQWKQLPYTSGTTDILQAVCKHNTLDQWSTCNIIPTSSHWSLCPSGSTTITHKTLNVACQDYNGIRWSPNDAQLWCNSSHYPLFPSRLQLTNACVPASIPVEQLPPPPPAPKLTNPVLYPSASVAAGDNIKVNWVYTGYEMNTVSIFLTGITMLQLSSSSSLYDHDSNNNNYNQSQFESLSSSPAMSKFEFDTLQSQFSITRVLGTFPAPDNTAIVTIPVNTKPTFNADIRIMVVQAASVSVLASSNASHYLAITEPDLCANVECSDVSTVCDKYSGKCICPQGYEMPPNTFDTTTAFCQLTCTDKCMNGGVCEYDDTLSDAKCNCDGNANEQFKFNGEYCEINEGCSQTPCNSRGFIMTHSVTNRGETIYSCMDTCQCGGNWVSDESLFELSTPDFTQQCLLCGLLSQNRAIGSNNSNNDDNSVKMCDSTGTDSVLTARECTQCICLSGYHGELCDRRALAGTVSFDKSQIIAISPQSIAHNTVHTLQNHQLTTQSISFNTLQTSRSTPITLPGDQRFQIEQDMALSLGIDPGLVSLTKSTQTITTTPLTTTTATQTTTTSLAFSITSAAPASSGGTAGSGPSMDDLYNMWGNLQGNLANSPLANSPITSELGSAAGVKDAFDPICDPTVYSNCPKGKNPLLEEPPVDPVDPDDDDEDPIIGGDDDDVEGSGSNTTTIIVAVVVVVIVILGVGVAAILLRYSFKNKVWCFSEPERKRNKNASSKGTEMSIATHTNSTDGSIADGDQTSMGTKSPNSPRSAASATGPSADSGGNSARRTTMSQPYDFGKDQRSPSVDGRRASNTGLSGNRNAAIGLEPIEDDEAAELPDGWTKWRHKETNEIFYTNDVEMKSQRHKPGTESGAQGRWF